MSILHSAFCILHSQEIPFENRDGFIWVQATAAGGRSLNLLLDSGAQVSAINLSTSRELKLKGGRRVTVAGVHAESSGRWPVALEARIGPVELPKKYLVTDLSALQAGCRCHVDGLLGADFFRDRVVQIDNRRGVIRIGDQLEAAGEIIPLQAGQKSILAGIQINGANEQWMRLDTGCASDLEWVAPDGSAKARGKKLSVGLTEVSVPMTKVEVRIGSTVIANVPAGLHSKEIFPGESGLLGNGLLQRFDVVTIDVPRGRLVLQGMK